MTFTNLLPIANHLWQSTLCVGAVWLLTVVLKKNSAAIRYWLWFGASVKFLLPFSLLVSLGSHLGWRTVQAAPLALPQWSTVVEDISQPFVATSPAIEASVPRASFPGAAMLLGLWFCGFAGSVVFWFRNWQKIRATEKAATLLHLALPIPVMSSSARVEPSVIGIRKPVLLLPKGIEGRLTPEQLTAVLAHEMCHVRRRDNLTAAMHMIVEAVFWFYPLVWWIRAHLVEEREHACDEAVLQSGSDAEAYAEGILNVCKFYVESPLPCLSAISGSDLKKRIICIMTEKVSRKLDLSRKLLLSLAVVMAVAVPVGVGLLHATLSLTDPQAEKPATSGPSYEVASIKPTKSDSDIIRIGYTGDGFTATATLQMLIRDAYTVQDSQILGAPKWVSSQKYDIEAKMDPSAAEELDKLGFGQSTPERRRMVQALLADRFKLSLHHETKEGPVYALIIAKNGPKLEEVKEGPGMGFGRGQLTSTGAHLEMLVLRLSALLGRPVLDKTGLKGYYKFSLQWTPDEGEVQDSIFSAVERAQSRAHNAPASESSGPSIFTALQEQLGLELESQRGPVDVLVIDHVEKPSEN